MGIVYSHHGNYANLRLDNLNENEKIAAIKAYEETKRYEATCQLLWWTGLFASWAIVRVSSDYCRGNK